MQIPGFESLHGSGGEYDIPVAYPLLQLVLEQHLMARMDPTTTYFKHYVDETRLIGDAVCLQVYTAPMWQTGWHDLNSVSLPIFRGSLPCSM